MAQSKWFERSEVDYSWMEDKGKFNGKGGISLSLKEKYDLER